MKETTFYIVKPISPDDNCQFYPVFYNKKAKIISPPPKKEQQVLNMY